MINRTYVVLMPSAEGEVPISTLDILVQNDPGTQDEPVIVGSDGAYYELRGRPVRFPVLAAQGASAGFVPRARLGVSVTVTAIGTAAVTALPGVQLSESLIDLSSTDTGPTISVPVLADPDGPSITLTGSDATDQQVYLVSLLIAEAKDEDRTPTGV